MEGGFSQIQSHIDNRVTNHFVKLKIHQVQFLLIGQI